MFTSQQKNGTDAPYAVPSNPGQAALSILLTDISTIPQLSVEPSSNVAALIDAFPSDPIPTIVNSSQIAIGAIWSSTVIFNTPVDSFPQASVAV